MGILEVVVKIDERGRILIPKGIRRQLGVEAGSLLLLRLRSDSIIELTP